MAAKRRRTNGGVWDAEEAAESAIVEVRGEEVEVEVGANFVSTVTRIAHENGLGKFRIFSVDEEGESEQITTSNAPEEIEEGMYIEIVPEDKGAYLALV